MKRKPEKPEIPKLDHFEKRDLLLNTEFKGWPFKTVEGRRLCWEAHKEELMAYVGPGRKPAAWYCFDAKEAKIASGGD